MENLFVLTFFFISGLHLAKSELKYFCRFEKWIYSSLSSQVNWKLNASCIFIGFFLPLSVSVCRMSSPDVSVTVVWAEFGWTNPGTQTGNS